MYLHSWGKMQFKNLLSAQRQSLAQKILWNFFAFWCGVGPQPFYQSVDGKMMRLKPHGRDIEVALISRSWSLALHFACEPSETSSRVHSTFKDFNWHFAECKYRAEARFSTEP
jgi:hypothetical protein